MKKLQLNEMEQLQGGKFWGKECEWTGDVILVERYAGYVNAYCPQACTQYIMWIDVGSSVYGNVPCTIDQWAQ